MAQTEALTTIQVFHGGGIAPATIAEEYNREAGSPRMEVEALSRLFAAIGSGVRPARVVVSTDSCVGTLASLTLAVTQANIAAGEYIAICVPGRQPVKITAVASGAVAASGEFVSQTSNTVTAAAMATAINAVPGLFGYVTAQGSSGNLIITAAEYGTVGNAIAVVDGTGNGVSPAGGNLAGGLDSSVLRTASVAITHANVTNGDTVTIGTVVITAATAAAGTGQWTIGANATADAVAMAAAINAHPSLIGRISASIVVAGTVTLTYLADAGGALLVGLKTSDATAFGLTDFSAGVAFTSVTAPRTYSLGVP